MTYEQAIDVLRNTAWLGSEDRLSLVEQAIATVSESRHIRKKVERTKYGNFICPVCHSYLHEYDNYCTRCGQAIDWEVSNENND